MQLDGNEEDKMKRISPVLFLTAAATIFLNDQTSFAQSQSSDMAPGPIAELLPEFDGSLNRGLEYPRAEPAPNRLPAPDRQPQQASIGENLLPDANALPAATLPENSLPLFDRPAQPRSAGATIDSPPPVMPAAAAVLRRSPGDFYPGSAPVGAGQDLIPSAVQPSFSVQSNNCQSAMVVSENDCGCDTCNDGEVVSTSECDSCNTCDSSEEYFHLDEIGSEDDCSTDKFCQSEDGFYDTGANRIDGHSSRRRGKTGIFARHRAKHDARKERRTGGNQDDQRYDDQEQYVAYQGDEFSDQDQACDIGDYNDVAPAVAPINPTPIIPAPVNGSAVNTTIGISGLYFSRNYEDDRQFSASRFANERGLFSNDADHDNFGGYDVNLARRKANGNGFEARYFSLEPSRETATLGGGPFTTLSGGVVGARQYLSGVGLLGANSGSDITAADIFNYADVHQVVRETDIQNVEFNLLRLGLTGQRNGGSGRMISHEYLFGFRYFRFDESFNYNAQVFRPGNIASGLARADYLNQVTNTLFGLQIGGRTEIGFLKRFSLIVGTKAGIFNNDFTNNQNVNFSPRGADVVTAQVLDGPYRGQAFATEGSDSEITMLGEVDLGVTYQMTNNSRLRVGYRALFVPNVALAVPQTEMFFTDLNAVQNPTDNDDLFLQGGYFGAEFAF